MTTTINTLTPLNKPILRQGAKGETVKELQKLLFQYHMFVHLDNKGACVFPGEEVIDGIFGAKTTDAVKLFQNQMFLTHDGIVGDSTWKSLYKGVPIGLPVLKKGSQGDLVNLIQERMSLEGYYKGIIDGNFGASTETAVKALQKRAGLTTDGAVGDQTWASLSKINTIFC
ncbi:peptidoglycan-binding protein [Calothrix sp. HK-06]|nr:peptidoglycan-binding protein [Calothrix sp. HK-06]